MTDKITEDDFVKIIEDKYQLRNPLSKSQVLQILDGQKALEELKIWKQSSIHNDNFVESLYSEIRKLKAEIEELNKMLDSYTLKRFKQIEKENNQLKQLKERVEEIFRRHHQEIISDRMLGNFRFFMNNISKRQWTESDIQRSLIPIMSLLEDFLELQQLLKDDTK